MPLPEKIDRNIAMIALQVAGGFGTRKISQLLHIKSRENVKTALKKYRPKYLPEIMTNIANYMVKKGKRPTR